MQWVSDFVTGYVQRLLRSSIGHLFDGFTDLETHNRQMDTIKYIEDNCIAAEDWMNPQEMETAREIFENPNLGKEAVSAFAEMGDSNIDRLHQSYDKQLCWPRLCELLWWTKETAPAIIHDSLANLLYDASTEL